MKTKLIYFPILFLLVSCSSKVDITFPTEFVKNNKVVLNGEFNLQDNIQDGKYSTIAIKPGAITVDVNGEVKKFRTVKGGLLNLDERNYMVFPIDYGGRSQTAGKSNIVFVDSILYFGIDYVGLADSVYNDIAAKAKLLPYHSQRAEKRELSVVNKTDFFAERSWVNSLQDEIAESVEIKNNSANSGVVSHKTIRPIGQFQFYCLTNERFGLFDLRTNILQKGVNPRVEEKRKLESIIGKKLPNY